MLEAGEDARFIARRLIILASEDVGMADPNALVVAVAAAHAVEHVGLPEAQLNLAQAVVHLATAPKSNRAALAIWKARDDVQQGVLGEVPAHLRDAHYSGRQDRSGTAPDTTTLMTTPGAGCRSGTFPSSSADTRYYEPSVHGFEQEIAERMSDLTPTGRTPSTERQ